MLANDRYKKILSLLNDNGSVKNKDLTDIFNISLETVRRDLDALEKQGLLRKVHGGAVLDENYANDDTYQGREKKNLREKMEIAALAVKYIEDGDTIALNSSTTNTEIAKLLKGRFNVLTVITNSLAIAIELSDIKGITLILGGGVYNKNEKAFLGEKTASAFDDYIVSKAFITVSGISFNRGVTDYLQDEVVVEKKFMEIAERVIIIADSSKINSNSLIKVCDIGDVDCILTDSNLSESIRDEFKENGIELICG